MGDILSLAKKLERAMRNGRGFQITPDEVAAIVECDVANAVMAAKMAKLKALCSARAGAAPSTRERPTQSGPPVQPTAPLNGNPAAFIKALGVGF